MNDGAGTSADHAAAALDNAAAGGGTDDAGGARKKRQSRAKRWVFTINNPGEAERPAYDPAIVEYLCYQLERGEQEGVPHYQGFIVFKEQRYFSTVKQYLGSRTHIELARLAIKNKTTKTNQLQGEQFSMQRLRYKNRYPC